MKKKVMRLKKLLLLLFVFTFSAAIAFGQDCGDVNSDGIVDIVDALLVAQCYVRIRSCPPDDIGDVNCDGAIDIIDSLLIAQFYVGLIDTLYCCGTPTEEPDPTPEGDVTLEMQAEDATWSSGGVETNHWGYTGNGYVNTDNATGEWIEWTVEVNRDCNATCVFTYACESDARPMDLSINGATASLDFPASGAWDTWKTETADVILEAGTNAIRLTATGSSGAPNMDKMDITIKGGVVITPTPTPTSIPTLEMQAEDATWSSGNVESCFSGYTGSGYVNTDNATGEWIEWTVEVDRDCNAVCVFTYAVSGSDRPMDLSVNGNVQTSVSFPDTGAWATWDTDRGDIILSEGTNAIRLTSTTGNGSPIIDKMDITINGGAVVTPTPSPTSVPTPTPTPTDPPTPTPTPTDPPTPPTGFSHAYFQKSIMIAVNHKWDIEDIDCNALNNTLKTGLPVEWGDISASIGEIKKKMEDPSKENAINDAATFIEANWDANLDIRGKIEQEIDKAFETNCYYIRFEQSNYCTTYVFLDVNVPFGGQEFAFYVFVLALQLRAQDLKPTQDPADLFGNPLQPSYIDQISPDWLLTAHNMIEGGPGGAAAECTDTTTLLGQSAAAYQFLIQDGTSIQSASEFFDGKVGGTTSPSEVHVYILDTVPLIYDHDSISTYDEKKDTINDKICRMPDTDNPAKLLLGTLPLYGDIDFFKRNDSFPTCDSCYSTPCCDICKPDILGIPDLDYNTPIPDHGIFIAGLIQSIAPDATIEILQTLNSAGVGSMQTFLCTLNYIHDIMKTNMSTNKKIIINCSFGLKCSFQDPGNDYEAIVADPWAVDLTVVEPLETLMYMFSDTTVFASTGNNNGAESAYPAALDLAHVIGVGSLGIEGIAGSDLPLYKRASYSNTTKRTMLDPATGQTIVVTNGFYAPGGMLSDSDAGMTSDRKGLFGLYLGDEGTDNPPVYGYWCGTSFAAPLVAGVFANLYRAKDRDQVISILQNLEGNLTDNNTEDDEFFELDTTNNDIIAVPIIQQHMYNNR